jgi:hypothetical protein
MATLLFHDPAEKVGEDGKVGQLGRPGVAGLGGPPVRAFTSDAADRAQAFAITAEPGGGVASTRQPVVEATA